MLQALPSFGRFWRYNYRIVAGSGYWILAVPIALSQIVTLWMMALSSDFSQDSANRIGEMMTPILGAFLVAHSLAPEYRSGAGAVLACKPVSLSRVLAMRAALGMLFALLLSLVTLLVCSIGLKPVNVWTPLLACLPSLWFLSTLALLLATVFRNPLGGFGVALVLWGLDLALGFAVHPLLSAQGVSSSAEGDALARMLWPAGKAVQVVAGCLLWVAHGSQLPRLCRAPERRDVLRLVATAAAVVFAYCVSGATTVVGYAHLRRGGLEVRDVNWIRRYLRVYGPLPVHRLFGPAFAAYVDEAEVGKGGSQRSARIRQLEQAVQRWPRSMWADAIAYELALEKETVEPQGAALGFISVADRFGDSPFGPKALAAVLRLEGEATSDDVRLLASRRLIADYPRAAAAEDAAEVLEQYHPAQVRAEELLRAARVAEPVAPAHRKPRWLVTQAELELGLGKHPEARQHAEAARVAARALEAESQGKSDRALELRPYQALLASVARAAEEVLARLDAGR